MDSSVPSAQEMKLVVFQLNGEEFAAPIVQVREIIRVPAFTRMPRAPEYVAGIMNLRGLVFPVVDLKKRFKMERGTTDERARVMVVEIEDQVLGLMVDDVREVLRAGSESYETTPPMIAEVTGQYLKGVIKVEGRLLLLLDLDRIFTTEEISEVNQALSSPGGGETAPL